MMTLMFDLLSAKGLRKAGLWLAISALCGAAQAANIVLPIDADTYLDSAIANANVNYGANGSVKVLINGTDESVCRGLFQLPPETATYEADRVAKAQVCFYLSNTNNINGRNFTLYPLTRTFSESSATWNTYDGTNAWNTAGSDFDTNFPVVGVRGTDGFFRWDITGLLANAAARSNLTTYGALLQIDEFPIPTNMPRAPFTSSDGTTASQRPFLQMTVRPQYTYPIATDTYMDSSSANANVNYGANGSVKVLINGTDGSLCRGLFQMPPEVVAYDTVKLSKALVCFYLFSDKTEGRHITLFPLTRSFAEDGATWNTYDGTNAWTTAGGDFDTNYPVIATKGSDGFFRWDITGLLTDDAARSNLVAYGALLQIDEFPVPTNMPRAPFTSSDGTTASQRPFVQMIANAHLAFPIVTDAHLDSRDTSKNFGASTSFKVVVNAATNRDGTVTRGLFQLPAEVGIYDPADIESVKVFYFASRDLTGERPITLYPLNQAFAEGTENGTANATGATWNTYDGTNDWATAGGDFDTAHSVEAVKEPILDPDLRARYFSWDITDLLANETVRSNLITYGAIVKIDEGRPRYDTDIDDMPRAPFNSAEHTDVAYRPYVEMVVVPRPVTVPLFTVTENSVAAMDLSDCTPYVSYRIERTRDLAAPDWIAVTNIVSTNGYGTSWSETIGADWTNAYYRIVIE